MEKIYNTISLVVGYRKTLSYMPVQEHRQLISYVFSSRNTFFANAQFDASFPAAFTAFAKSGDPNVHPVPNVITPSWSTYNISNTEMLFNMTEDGQPDIRPVRTDSRLLERCA
jgi:hypothetical protein